jgi:DNA-binding NtrC family response regulator
MRILIVDDEKDCLDDIAQMLELSDFKVNTTTSPIEALQIYEKFRFDCVLTDMRMPEMNGLELLKKIKSYDPKANVIILTAYGDLETAIEAINSKVYAFFSKPVDFKELVLTLRQIENEIDKEKLKEIDFDQLKKLNEILKSEYSKLLRIVNDD